MSENEERGYTLIGGNGVRVKPLEVQEDGTYKAGDSEAFNPVIVKASGGGSSGGGVLTANFDSSTGALDKTWSEIASAPFTVITRGDENSTNYDPIHLCIRHDAEGRYPDYSIETATAALFVAPSEDGYPVITD